METFEAIFSRISTRDFAPGIPAESDIDKIIAAGMAAPVGRGRYDSLHLTVITDKALLNEITSFAAGTSGRPRSPFYGAPVLIVVSSLMPPSPSIEYSNVGTVIENMALAATDLGLANIYLWSFASPLREHPDTLAKLALPEGFVPVSGLAVGFSSQSLPAPSSTRHNISVNRV